MLVRNSAGILPLAAGQKVALIGPVADDPMALLGCYSFPSHVGHHHPGYGLGVEVPTLREALGALVPDLAYAPGCAITGDDRDGFAAAVALAADSDVCVLAVGDRPGMFGRGTTGEGSDADDLRLPGVQAELVDAVLATGTPVVVVVLAGRPYALGAAARRRRGGRLRLPGRPARRPGGRRGADRRGEPVRPAAGQRAPAFRRPARHLPVAEARPPLQGVVGGPHPRLPVRARPELHDVRVVRRHRGRATPGWRPAADADAAETAAWPVDGEATVGITVRNTGDRAGTEVVQLYLHDPVAQTTQPVVRLVGYQRVPLEPGEAARVTFTVPADLASFTGSRGQAHRRAG